MKFIARKPHYEQNDKGAYKYDCPRCGCLLCMNCYVKYPYCAWCGQKIKWHKENSLPTQADREAGKDGV